MEMKTLATCKPSEFFEQTSRITKSVEKWITATDIINIRKRLPHKELPTVNMSAEERAELEARNKAAMEKQMRENLAAILESVLETHAKETLEVLALCCFVEPKDVDKHPMSAYLKAINELINNEEVVNFFISLVRLERILTPKA